MYFLSRCIIFLLLTSACCNVFGRTTRTATLSGDWKDASRWSTASAPAFNQTNNTDDIVIDIAGATPGVITLDDNFTLKTGTTLTIKGCDTLIITGDAVFSNGSFIQVDPCAKLIIQGNLENKNNSNNINIDGGLTVGGNYTGGNGSVISGSGTTNVIGSITLSGSGTITTDILPIELIEFTATFNEDRVDLYWSTASEINNEKFIIEKSKDGYTWQEVLMVAGAGNSSSIIEYYESDKEPLSGVSYYRLKQVDYDGKSETFNVVPVENIENGMIAFNIFPNPTTQENINLSFTGLENKEILVIVRDVQGKEYYSKVTIVNSSEEIQVLSVDQHLPSGIYLVTASSINELYSQKIIIK